MKKIQTGYQSKFVQILHNVLSGLYCTKNVKHKRGILILFIILQLTF